MVGIYLELFSRATKRISQTKSSAIHLCAPTQFMLQKSKNFIFKKFLISIFFAVNGRNPKFLVRVVRRALLSKTLQYLPPDSTRSWAWRPWREVSIFNFFRKFFFLRLIAIPRRIWSNEGSFWPHSTSFAVLTFVQATGLSNQNKKSKMFDHLFPLVSMGKCVQDVRLELKRRNRSREGY